MLDKVFTSITGLFMLWFINVMAVDETVYAGHMSSALILMLIMCLDIASLQSSITRKQKVEIQFVNALLTGVLIMVQFLFGLNFDSMFSLISYVVAACLAGLVRIYMIVDTIKS